MQPLFILIYFGLGVLTNLALLGPIIWTSWTAWAVLLLWPAFWAVVALLVFFAIYFAVVFFAWLVESVLGIGFVDRWRARRFNARAYRKSPYYR